MKHINLSNKTAALTHMGFICIYTACFLSVCDIILKWLSFIFHIWEILIVNSAQRLVILKIILGFYNPPLPQVNTVNIGQYLMP
jgi:hypothetical protein